VRQAVHAATSRTSPPFGDHQQADLPYLAAATERTVSGPAEEVSTVEVLVSIASKHGSTDEIAEVIADHLRAVEATVDLVPPDEVTAVDRYDGIILGSAVYAGRWMAPAVRFAERFADVLVTKPVWLLSSGPLGDPPAPAEDPVSVAPIRERTGARDHRVFAGRARREDLSLAERAVVRAVHAPYGDFRDWAEIEAWTCAIVAHLAEQARTVERARTLEP
jgi:menaquinone-dependent protoporphyrinogen oxidase